MCARSSGQLVCVNRLPRRTQAPSVSAAKPSAKDSRRRLGARSPEEGSPSGALVGNEPIDDSSVLPPNALRSRPPAKLGCQLLEAREPLLPQLSVLDGGLNGAAGLRVVPAVDEAASPGE